MVKNNYLSTLKLTYMSAFAQLHPRRNMLVKVLLVFVLSLLLLIPQGMVSSLIWERQSVQESAIQEVSEKWGGEQVFGGPYLSIPYKERREEWEEIKDNREQALRKEVKIFYDDHQWVVLPNHLKIQVQVMPEIRKRGIYQVVVYRSNAVLTGSLNLPRPTDLGIDSTLVDWDKARWIFALPDPKGIETAELSVNDQTLPLVSGEIPGSQRGISAKMDGLKQGMTMAFQFQLDVNGSQTLSFVPLGKTTEVHVEGAWPSPSFNGQYLPDSSQVGKSFSAWWKILHLNRSFPETWKDETYQVYEDTFGLSLFSPVDHYQKSHRSVKYAYMFIVLTFIALFFMEMWQRIFVHPMQYLLTGLALVIFYALLIALSEHWSFNWAYGVSSLATILLIGGYIRGILSSGRLAGMMVGILTILYTFIFIILQQEDYALLMGSIGMFLILGIIMYFSRKIDWSLSADTPQS
jgi:inner membrane protein